MTDMRKLYNERCERVANAIKHTPGDRVPVSEMIETWAGHTIGQNVVDQAYDYSKLREANIAMARELGVDVLPPPLGVRCGNLYTAGASNEFFFFDKEGKSYNSVQHTEAPGGVMRAEEYPELIADPYKFILEKQLPRRYRELDTTPEHKAMVLAQCAMTYQTYMAEAVAKLGGILAEEYGMPLLFKGSTEMPMDCLMDYFRGFKGISMDIKRRKEEVIAACEALYPLMIKRAIHGVEAGIFPTIFIPLHIPTYLRPKDFEKFYWPTFKKMIDTMVENDITPHLFMEGNWEPYYDFINQLPKRKVVGLIESGDFKKAKKAIGDTICIMGGMPTDVINNSSKEEAINYAKQLVDDLAPGGGYIFALDKVLIAPNDANMDTLKAVFEAVKEYGKY